MRAGQALSALLDPGKPPMFADDAEQLRQLLTEETWEKAQRAQHGAAPQRTQRQQQNGGVRSGAAAATGSARQRRREERAVRRRPREVPRVQRDAGEDAEGPLTETDSDDAGGSSSDNSGMTSSGSASSAEMEPYDLEESDEDDPAKSKLQVGGGRRLLPAGLCCSSRLAHPHPHTNGKGATWRSCADRISDPAPPPLCSSEISPKCC